MVLLISPLDNINNDAGQKSFQDLNTSSHDLRSYTHLYLTTTISTSFKSSLWSRSFWSSYFKISTSILLTPVFIHYQVISCIYVLGDQYPLIFPFGHLRISTNPPFSPFPKCWSSIFCPFSKMISTTRNATPIAWGHKGRWSGAGPEDSLNYGHIQKTAFTFTYTFHQERTYRKPHLRSFGSPQRLV